jgi:hypothetical protein
MNQEAETDLGRIRETDLSRTQAPPPQSFRLIGHLGNEEFKW